MKSTGLVIFLCLALLAVFNGAASEPVQVIELWPKAAPGEKGDLGEEKDTTKPTDQPGASRERADLFAQPEAGKRALRIARVSDRGPRLRFAAYAGIGDHLAGPTCGLDAQSRMA